MGICGPARASSWRALSSAFDSWYRSVEAGRWSTREASSTGIRSAAQSHKGPGCGDPSARGRRAAAPTPRAIPTKRRGRDPIPRGRSPRRAAPSPAARSPAGGDSARRARRSGRPTRAPIPLGLVGFLEDAQKGPTSDFLGVVWGARDSAKKTEERRLEPAHEGFESPRVAGRGPQEKAGFVAVWGHGIRERTRGRRAIREGKMGIAAATARRLSAPRATHQIELVLRLGELAEAGGGRPLHDLDREVGARSQLFEESRLDDHQNWRSPGARARRRARPRPSRAARRRGNSGPGARGPSRRR